jgi:hypothetical protein
MPMVINIWFPVTIKMYETAPSKTIWVFSCDYSDRGISENHPKRNVNLKIK